MPWEAWMGRYFLSVHQTILGSIVRSVRSLEPKSTIWIWIWLVPLPIHILSIITIGFGISMTWWIWIDMDRQSPGDGRDISVPASWVMSGGRFLTQIWTFRTMKDHMSLEISSNIPIFQLQNSLGRWLKPPNPWFPMIIFFYPDCLSGFSRHFTVLWKPPFHTRLPGPHPTKSLDLGPAGAPSMGCIVSRNGRFSSYTPCIDGNIHWEWWLTLDFLFPNHSDKPV